MISRTPTARSHCNDLPRNARMPAADATLWAGDLRVESRPTRLATVLGSCVAVCLHDRTRGIGGMNHYLLPDGASTLKHGRWSIACLVAEMHELGCAIRNLDAKIFGGGSPLALTHEEWSIGQENITIAREMLAESGIGVTTERVGGPAGMRVVFESWTGIAWVRPHKPREGAVR